MKKVFSQIYMLMAAAICLTACDDKNDSDYTPGTPTADDCMQVYFDNSNASDFITEPGVGSSIDVYVSRVDTTEAAEVPIVCKSAASELSVPSSVKFDAGQKTATLTIGYGDLKESQKYEFNLAIDEAYADHYSKLDGSTTFSGYVLEAAWATYITGAELDFTVGSTALTWTVDIERLGETERYCIKNFLESGVDLKFSVGTDADGMSGYYKVLPYTNYYDYIDETVNAFYLYDTATGSYPTWTIGGKTIVELCIMRSYTGYGDYSYISFEEGFAQFGTYWTTYDDETYDYYNYIKLYFDPIKE